jgi:Zeta toxin
MPGTFRDLLRPRGLAATLLILACLGVFREKNSSIPTVAAAEAAATNSDTDFSVDPKVLAAADEAIREPDSDAEIPALLAAIERHPYHQEVMRRLKLAGDLATAGTAHQNKGPDGAYTPERDKLHQTIVEAQLNPAAKAKAGKKPIAILVVGLPGSGKTTVESSWPKRLDITCSMVNSDDIQSRLPEFQGWNVDLLRAEARELEEQLLLPRAIAERHNLIVEVTGRDSERSFGFADSLGRAGYQIYLVYVDLPVGKAAFRTWRRFRGGAFKPNVGDPDSGRFVSPRLVATAFGTKPRETYTALKKHPAVVHWLSVNTSGGHEKPPVVEEEGPAELPPAAK